MFYKPFDRCHTLVSYMFSCYLKMQIEAAAAVDLLWCISRISFNI